MLLPKQVSQTARAFSGVGQGARMDYTPEDMEAVHTCLEGLNRNLPVTVEPGAAALLLPNTVRSC
jgi:hypothetical protein